MTILIYLGILQGTVAESHRMNEKWDMNEGIGQALHARCTR
jgi:hypothetical protein